MPFQKGNKLGGRTYGAKGHATILKEERRAIFDAEVSKMFIQKIHEARPEYLLDQFLDKAKDKLDVTLKEEPSDRIKLLAEKLRKLDAE
jgi:hypothetical protein